MTVSPQITFYGGIGTIGGTKIAITEGDYRVLFDFGSTFAPGGDFWAGKLQPRLGPARLRDMIALGYTPALGGLYQTTAANAAGLKPGKGDTTQVFISHLHLDHMALVDLLADEVPVWMHSDALRLFGALATVGERPCVPVGARDFVWGDTVTVGPIQVTPAAVDHDIPGACGLLIKTSAGTVVYSGDLRLHGAAPELTEKFVRAARATGPKILLIEGTRMGELANPDPERLPPLKETEVPGRVTEILREYPGLGLITLYPRNIVRITAIVRAASALGRTLVLSPEVAHVYSAMGGDLKGAAVYVRSRDRHCMRSGKAEPWLTHLLGSGVTMVDAAAVKNAPGRYLLQLCFCDLGELVDVAPPEGSVFIHSNGEPLGRFDPNYDVLLRWLERFGIAMKYASSTGHAGPADLQAVVAGIAPEVLMPIHSMYPELLEAPGIARVLPDVGATYDIATGERIG